MKKLFVAVLMLSIGAWAQTSHVLGTWKGDLAYQDSDGYTATCTTTNTFTAENDMLTMHQVLSGDCEWETTITMEMKGEEIWQNGMKIGQFTGDNALEVKDYMVDDCTSYSFAMTTDNDDGTHGVFSDQTNYLSDDYMDSLTGEMTKNEIEPMP